MNRFTKKPLKAKTKTMKINTKYIIGALTLCAILMWAYTIHINKVEALKNEIIGVTSAYETAIEPTELEKMLISDKNSKNKRAENRKVIDKLEQENKDLRQEEYERAKKVQEMTSLSFQ